MWGVTSAVSNGRPTPNPTPNVIRVSSIKGFMRTRGRDGRV